MVTHVLRIAEHWDDGEVHHLRPSIQPGDAATARANLIARWKAAGYTYTTDDTGLYHRHVEQPVTLCVTHEDMPECSCGQPATEQVQVGITPNPRTPRYAWRCPECCAVDEAEKEASQRD